MAQSIQDYLKRVKAEIKEVTNSELLAKLESHKKGNGSSFVLVDVREKEEQNAGVIPGALLLPKGVLEMNIESVIPTRSTEIVLYCAAGNRSALAAKALEPLGYTNVSSLNRGYNGWNNDGLPIEVRKSLSSEQLSRYSRHLLLPEVGEQGQIKLNQARVLMIGAGGLGSPAALYLAAAGVGRLGIIDHDFVDKSNLQRQILHNEERVGVNKAKSAKQTLELLNGDVKVTPYEERLSSENVMRIFKDWDIVVDGTDNFPTRYLINDACVFLNKPNVHGSIFRFEGQATVFWPGVGPCYRCLYPEPPPPELAPSCQEAGVLGVLPGIVGSIQAIETIKIILGVGDTLAGRLLMFDSLGMKFREMKLRKDKTCPVCGEHPTIKELIDYEQFCGIPA